MATATKDVSLNKKVSQFFWRSWAIQASWNYERQMNMGFLYGMVPTLDRLYPDESDPKQLAAKKEAYHRHMAFYNCTPQTSAFILGLAASMEEEYAKDPENFNPDSINAVKTSLMGPLSGLGDSFFLSTLRVVAAAVGISLCQAGNVFGPIAFLLVYNIPAFLIRIFGAIKGYELGIGFLDEAQKTGLMQKIMACVGIVGVMVVGAMSKDMFWASLPIAIGQGDSAQTLQDILDGIMPGMLGMAAFWLYYWLLSKKINPMVLILCTMVVGIIGAYFGVLA